MKRLSGLSDCRAQINEVVGIMVPEAGFEPARSYAPRDFKSLASTNSATPASRDFVKKQTVIKFHIVS